MLKLFLMRRAFKIIAHLDLDCFFVSVERIFHPELKDKPVIVSGKPEGRGVVSSASYEARAYGVKNGMALKQAKKLCPEAVVLPLQMELYAYFSEQVFNLLKEFSPLVEEASVDEAYLDLSGCEKLFGSPKKTAQLIQKTIKEKLALPCSIGIGSNKLVAKVASKLAKPEGILEVPAGKEEEFLAEFPIDILPGIGGKTKDRLQLLGAKKVKHLLSLGSKILQEHFGKFGLEIYKRAQGLGETELVVEQVPPKSLGKEITFDRDIFDPKEKEEWLYLLILKLGIKLREHNLYAQRLTLKFRSPDFTTWSRSIRLPTPSNQDKVLLAYAQKVLERENPSQPLRLLGVSGGDLVPIRQLDLFEQEKTAKQEQLLKALDQLRKIYGISSIYPAELKELISQLKKGGAR